MTNCPLVRGSFAYGQLADPCGMDLPCVLTGGMAIWPTFGHVKLPSVPS